ncbi:ABC transporter permease [Roseivirga sp.]|uniref:ABC transporter permease n=1 Tax=Roseivirga sp. TaxID=1964215 RepID=UPI003B530514
MKNINYAIRHLLKYKVFSLINILGLALGMAVVLYVSIYIHEETSVDKFHQDSERIYRLAQEQVQAGQTYQVAKMPGPLVDHLKTEYPELEKVSGVISLGGDIVFSADKVAQFEESGVYFVDEPFFELFNFSLVQGSLEDFENNDAVVITQSMARKYFGEEDPIGKTLYYSNRFPVKVVALVKEPEGKSHLEFDFLMSRGFLAKRMGGLKNWMSNRFYIYIKLNEQTNPLDFTRSIENVIAQNAGEKEWTPKVYMQPLEDIYLGRSFAFGSDTTLHGDMRSVQIALVIGLVILLIAIINFVNLSASIAGKRRKEIGVKKIIGARPAVLFKQVFTESFLQAIISTAIALTILQLCKNTLNAVLQVEIDLSITNTTLLLLTVGLTLGIGILAGLFPAISAARSNGLKSLRQGEDLKMAGGRNWLKNAMVMVQFTMSIMLIVGAYVVSQQLNFLNSNDLGFNKSSTLYLNVSPGAEKDYQTLKTELSALSQVNEVSMSTSIPINMGWYGRSWSWEGKEETTEDFMISFMMVDESFLSAYEIEVKEGTNFIPQPESSATTSYIVNQKAAEMMGLEDPVGKRFEDGLIVGVVENFHFKSLETEIEPLVLIYSEGTSHYSYVNLNIQANQLRETVNAVEDIYANLYPKQFFSVHFIEEELRLQYIKESNLYSLSTLFTAVAIFIACSGLFALASFRALQNQKQVCIRKVLGASSLEIHTFFSKQIILILLLSAVIAIPVVYWVMDGWLNNYAYAIDLTFTELVLPLLLVFALAFIVILFHSVKMARVNPASMLRQE